jgi:hypothetical protein
MAEASASPIVGYDRKGRPIHVAPAGMPPPPHGRMVSYIGAMGFLHSIAGGANLSGTYNDEQLTNDFVTTLNGAITNVALSLVVTSAAAFSATVGHWRIRITDGVNEEWIHATTRAGTTFSWPSTAYRGTENNDGTKTARAWSNGATVEFVATEAGLKNAFTGTPGPFSRRDYEIYGSGVTPLYVLVDNRVNAIVNTYTNPGAAANGAMTTAMLKGPVGSQSLGTPGATFSLVNTDPTNTAWTIPSTDWIGKPTASGVLGQVTSGLPGFVDTTATFTSADTGRLFYLVDNTGVTQLVTTIQSVTNATTIVMKDNATFTSSTNARWVEPITIGMKLFGQGGGTRTQGNGHPDDGGLFLQATGAGWGGKGLLDFRNAPNWTTQGFGSEFFELEGITLDGNSLADYALVGFGVGTGNAARCHSYTAQGGAVANVGIGNLSDHQASSDVFHTDFVLGKPASPTSKTWQSGAVTLQSITSGGSGIITLNNTTGLPTGPGFIEITSNQGIQLVQYAGISGSTLTGCIGGVGTMANGNAVVFQPYGFHVNEGDVYCIDDFNIAVNGHAFLINMPGAIGNCQIGQGHYGGGTGGPDIVIAYGKRVTIRGYSDNITGTGSNPMGGVWICPMTAVANQAVSHVIIDPSTVFNVNDTVGVPVIFDGANLGGDNTKGGFGYQICGQTNGHSSCPGFVKFVNGWPNGTGISMDNIHGTTLAALYANDAFTTWSPGGADTIGLNITLSTGVAAGNFYIAPFKPGGANTAGQPAATVGGNGSMSMDTQKNRLMYSDGTALRPFYTHLWVASTASGTGQTLTPNMSLGDAFVRTVTGTTAGSTLAINAPTQPLAGEEISIVVFNNTTTTGTVVTTFNAVFKFNIGAWTDPAQAKRKMVRFKCREDAATWDQIAPVTADYV